MKALIVRNRRRQYRLMVLGALVEFHYGRAQLLVRDGRRSGLWTAVNYMMNRGIEPRRAAKMLAETPIEAFEPVEGGA